MEVFVVILMVALVALVAYIEGKLVAGVRLGLQGAGMRSPYCFAPKATRLLREQ